MDRASSLRQHHEDTQSRLFGATSPPSTPSSRKSSTGSLVTMSPGRIIKQQHQRSNIFPSSQDSNGCNSSSSSSLDLTDSASIASAPSHHHIVHEVRSVHGTPIRRQSGSSSNGLSVSITPGRLIKQKHQTSNVFPVVETTHSNGNGNHHSYSSSVDLTDSASPPPTTP